MKKVLLTGILGLALLSVAATYTITQLTANSSPSNGTLIEIYDPTASPKSGKYFLTNLVNKAGDSGVGTLSVAGLTNTALTASRVVVSGADKSLGSASTTGLIKGDGSAATAGTDYMAPPTQNSLTHAGTVTLDLSALRSEADLTLTGAVTFATSNLAAGKAYTLYGRNTQATNCTPTFPSWRWMGGAPSTITALKEFTISLSSRGTVDTNVWAAYAEAQ